MIEYKGPLSLRRTVERAYDAVRDSFSCENPKFEVIFDPRTKNDLRGLSEPGAYRLDEDVIRLDIKVVLDASDDFNHSLRKADQIHSFQDLGWWMSHELTHRELYQTTQWGIKYVEASDAEKDRLVEVAERLKLQTIQEGASLTAENFLDGELILHGDDEVRRDYVCTVYAKRYGIPKQDFETSLDFFAKMADAGMSLPELIAVARDIIDESFRDNKDAVHILKYFL